ncbi:uncharacterized protein LOC127791017 [Diospyros lotus]|uniref:uncharacterized protein LOC127791017 n=1 Tax=Diospyros lotus TaxID=55363 RepID=UPI0022572240|nr:uncharacterized protein LOC127791017 [Diospyros lotus]
MDVPKKKQTFTYVHASRVLLREVKFPGARPDKMWFELGGVAYQYGKQEFTLITRLRFSPIDREILQTRPAKDGSLRTRLFPDKEVVNLEDIKELLDTKPDVDKDDALKMEYLAMVNMLLMGHDERASIEDFHWSLVQDLESFRSFPWGTYIYSQRLHYIRLATTGWKLNAQVGKKVNLYAFVWAFQV